MKTPEISKISGVFTYKDIIFELIKYPHLKKYYKYIFIATILFWTAANINWSIDDEKYSPLIYDARGYYSYLPAIFIYQDISYGFFDEIEAGKYRTHDFHDYRYNFNGHYINRYYCGTALMEMPFFFLGHLYCLSTDYPPDGFSRPYSIAINIGGIIYMLLGLFYLEKILQGFKIGHRNISILLMAIIFGTNAYVYSAISPGMSHTYSFFLFAVFSFLIIRYRDFPKKKYLLLLGLITGLIVLVRPINLMIILAIPFLLGSKNALFSFFRQLWADRMTLLLSMIISVSIGFIQLIIYKLQTGQFLVYSYGQYGFDFLHSHFVDFLFSYRKGFFLYTPLALLALLGLIPLYKENKFSSISLVSFLVFVVWVLSSWEVWYYGGSFSSRVMLEYSIFVFIPMGILLERIQYEKWWRTFVGLIAMLVIVCQIQIYQYRYYEIHWSETTKEMYWEHFLMLDRIFGE